MPETTGGRSQDALLFALAGWWRRRGRQASCPLSPFRSEEALTVANLVLRSREISAHMPWISLGISGIETLT
jgi:hypothetical protein